MGEEDVKTWRENGRVALGRGNRKERERPEAKVERGRGREGGEGWGGEERGRRRVEMVEGKSERNGGR